MNGLKTVFLSGVCFTLVGCSVLLPKDSPEDQALMHREAQAAFEQGNDAGALALYQKLTARGGQDAETWLRLGNIYARTGSPQLAEEAYRQSLVINPADVRALNNLGVVLLRQAWQAFVVVQQVSQPGDGVHERSAELVRVLERLPYVVPEKSR
jgi:cytochrome c-type biogenesis protein CcmH/NrfG